MSFIFRILKKVFSFCLQFFWKFITKQFLSKGILSRNLSFPLQNFCTTGHFSNTLIHTKIFMRKRQISLSTAGHLWKTLIYTKIFTRKRHISQCTAGYFENFDHTKIFREKKTNFLMYSWTFLKNLIYTKFSKFFKNV